MLLMSNVIIVFISGVSGVVASFIIVIVITNINDGRMYLVILLRAVASFVIVIAGINEGRL